VKKRRVVITGMGAVSPYGVGCDIFWNGLINNICTIKALDPVQMVGLHFKNASLVPDINANIIPRNLRRAMSPMSIYACLSAWEALAQAKIPLDDIPPNLGVYAASTLGSTQALEDFFREYIEEGDIESVKSMVFFKIMSHTVARSIAMACGLSGQLIAPCAACASGLLSIGMAYDSIASGNEDCILAGAAEEFHILTSATFDKLGAASHEENPLIASRPFDKDRDGLVIGEGAAIVLVESLEHAQNRNATILAEISSFVTRCSAKSIALPDAHAMQICMDKALKNASLTTKDIDYVNAHATATIAGDMAEAKAIADLFGKDVPVSSLKGYMGHTLAASGALEAIASIYMLLEHLIIPNYNLVNPDPDCAHLNFLQQTEKKELRHIMKNSFALGGVYASLILSSYIPD